MNLEDISIYKPTQKKSYTITCEVPGIGTKVHDVLNGADHVTDAGHPVVLTGTVGEQWVVTAETLMGTYTHTDGTAITMKDLEFIEDAGAPMVIRTKPGVLNFAYHLPLNLKPAICTSWGVTLLANHDGVDHGDGDYIVCSSKDGKPNIEDMWVVNGRVFENTYESIK